MLSDESPMILPQRVRSPLIYRVDLPMRRDHRRIGEIRAQIIVMSNKQPSTADPSESDHRGVVTLQGRPDLVPDNLDLCIMARLGIDLQKIKLPIPFEQPVVAIVDIEFPCVRNVPPRHLDGAIVNLPPDERVRIVRFGII